ncbi:hypothetical protein [Bradyrhizobium lablabi]|nr:hypothetical protein [Bradyrhizobium lablabi]
MRELVASAKDLTRNCHCGLATDSRFAPLAETVHQFRQVLLIEMRQPVTAANDLTRNREYGFARDSFFWPLAETVDQVRQSQRGKLREPGMAICTAKHLARDCARGLARGPASSGHLLKPFTSTPRLWLFNS